MALHSGFCVLDGGRGVYGVKCFVSCQPGRPSVPVCSCCNKLWPNHMQCRIVRSKQCLCGQSTVYIACRMLVELAGCPLPSRCMAALDTACCSGQVCHSWCKLDRHISGKPGPAGSLTKAPSPASINGQQSNLASGRAMQRS